MNRLIYFFLIIFVWCVQTQRLGAQNPLIIPQTLSGDTFNLEIQQGTTQFYSGINTPTYGINGVLLAPTLIFNKWDTVTLNVKNSLKGNGNSTTIHWHGLHLPAKYDGGPHQLILQNSTWSPKFRVLNNAGTFWYHPHGHGKTDLHVAKGIAGLIIIRDSAEANLNLPRNYGTDDFPVIVQSKAFDVLHQIAISTEEDTAILVNGVVNPYLNAPSQVIRLRLLNGSSMRSYNFGFTGNKEFSLIATDGGLLDSSVKLTRVRLSPGERVEILLDLQGMQGQSIFLNSFSSEFPNGIYGAKTVKSMMGGTIPDYNLNPLNGLDFGILKINVQTQTSNPVTTIPKYLVPLIRRTIFNVSRNLNFAPDSMMDPTSQVSGPFNINGAHFDMEVVNIKTYLNNSEKWRITNNTAIAHPFHIHDVQFDILNVNGGSVPAYQRGKKDVVLVMPQQYVEFVTKFENFADDSVPFMYHCHLLHHEDDGMMGSFLVVDTTTAGLFNKTKHESLIIYPNPASEYVGIKSDFDLSDAEILVINSVGKEYYKGKCVQNILSIANFPKGVYFIRIKQNKNLITKKIIVQ
ncbi:MAG: multicopper oxidase domain-containing protein [Bacteroidetes bacterium]|nr:multicopper oxidase domain-containing protein [Bacteroidota bacterium]